MAKPKLRLVLIDDWCALYADGESIFQGHSLRLEEFFDVLKAAGISTCMDFDSVYAGEGDQARAHDYGQLPETITELKDTEIP